MLCNIFSVGTFVPNKSPHPPNKPHDKSVTTSYHFRLNHLLLTLQKKGGMFHIKIGTPFTPTTVAHYKFGTPRYLWSP